MIDRDCDALQLQERLAGAKCLTREHMSTDAAAIQSSTEARYPPGDLAIWIFIRPSM